MGSSESKMTKAAPVNPEPAIKNNRVNHLMDPRSPSAGIDRTPIQVNGFVSTNSAVVKSKFPLVVTDPRSPTVGITRTPVREVMRATVGSLARRLGLFLSNEIEGKVPEAPQKLSVAVEEEAPESEELASTEPLLTPQPSQPFSSLAGQTNLLATPVLPPLHCEGNLSPFVILEEPQVEVDIETEEAEEARESPLHKRLSMSLITCHEGVTSMQIVAEMHCDSTPSPVPSEEVETLGDGVDHSYALPSITVEPSSATGLDVSPAQLKEEEKLRSSERTQELVKESSLPPATASPAPPVVLSPEQPQLCTGIRCPTFDSKSPSQVVFKPQWLGKGFGATGRRARGGQGPSGKGGSSPLSVRVAVKNVNSENRGQSGKLKQRGTEGRSPLQILKEANSPRDQCSQMKLKVPILDKQRFGHMDRTDCRVVALAQDKENR
uniref:Uncharacterized protein n=1 Tax=Monopterus albus TaxID=43700 RepID=A0A3Q3KGS9_MONAL|nr:cell division cycle-associated protein 3 [Monopterus albus]XP_020466532.1 cell division cycle-associated protein 3 [Monopterus albus]XP_020466533.1 cell division cycle-associated protein 3 [Monopterus albus]XP_020466534.1 cell division cycle-associated protein 3 [Monopterus albus]